MAALRADYARASPGSPAALVWRCLRASTHVLGPHPGALEQQLFGRLGASAEAVARSLAVSARAAIEGRPLVPTRPSLSRPGAREVTLAGHEGGVYGALLLGDGRRVLSWSDDRSLRLWDLASARELGCYFADAAVTAVAARARGDLAFVGDALGAVQVIRIRTG